MHLKQTFVAFNGLFRLGAIRNFDGFFVVWRKLNILEKILLSNFNMSYAIVNLI